MRITDSRRLGSNPQGVRRRRRCEICLTSFQTDERPRLWIDRGGKRELFLRGVLLESLRRAASGVMPTVAEEDLLEVVRLVIVGFLSEGVDSPTAAEVRSRTGRALVDRGQERVAYRFDPALDPDSFLVGKRDGAPEQAFDREKLRRSVAAASVKLLDDDAIEAVVVEVENDVGATSGHIDTAKLRALVNRSLRQHDERAFLRYDLGASGHDETLEDFLERVAPAASVMKRDGSAVLFDSVKLAKSIRRAFAPDKRESHAQTISDFVAGEERRARDRTSDDRQPEMTTDIGTRVLEWLFELDQFAWANYWLVFVGARQLDPGESPIRLLAKAQHQMRRSK